MSTARRAFAVVVPLLIAAACSQQPADVREWRPSDHDHTENPSPAQVDTSDGGSQGVMGVDEVGLAAWKANCTVCHGLLGRGDGPKGPSVRSRNLSDPVWQASVSDEQIAASIKNGKGKMPKADLPDSTVENLVRLVRLLNAARIGGGSDAGAASDAAVGMMDAAPADAGRRRGSADAKAPRPPPKADAGTPP
jgi:mono/diheme cytochrome c family protein